MSLDILYRNRDDYQRDNFDSFLSAVKFKFNTPSIHIAGTNGKGSTAFYIASILKEAGYKVGLFNSPYLIKLNNMILVNGEEIGEEKLEEYVNKYEKLFNKYDLSSFEMMTFIALSYFDEQECDVGVIECGMGGEIDATNIFTPIASVITSVSIEHSTFLGKSLSEIAVQKSGIIKPTIPVILGVIGEEAKNVIKENAKYKGSNVIEIVEPYNIDTNSGGAFDYKNYKQLHIKSNALYSITDASIAIETIENIAKQFPIKQEHIYKGLDAVAMCARNTITSNKPLVIVDGAHNPEAIENLVKSIEKVGICKDFHIVFACFRDKNIATILPNLSYLTNDITITSFDHPRARQEEDYFLFLEEYKYSQDHIQVIKDLMEKFPDDAILVTGSLAFAALVKKEFDDGVYAK